MNITKCENGHIYDMDKFDDCPHCSNINAGVTNLDILGSNQKNVQTILSQGITGKKTVGFLVCVKGEMTGNGFILREGMNYIGRASNMEVALTKELTVSRIQHAGICFDESNKEYIITTDKDNVLCNGIRVVKKAIIKDRCKIEIGDCVLIFIEFNLYEK